MVIILGVQILRITLRCLSIGTPNTTIFPFIPNGKRMVIRIPIFKHIIIRPLCAQILGHLKIINFPFGTNGNLLFLGVPILKHITVLW